MLAFAEGHNLIIKLPESTEFTLPNDKKTRSFFAVEPSQTRWTLKDVEKRIDELLDPRDPWRTRHCRLGYVRFETVASKTEHSSTGIESDVSGGIDSRTH